MPGFLAALGSAGATNAIAGSAMVSNPLFAHLTNVRNRKFTREMYNRQRQDALSDWAMQTAYDSPRAQMQRFQEAGLNPHLIYGQMSNSPVVRSSQASGGMGQAPQVDPAPLMQSAMMSANLAQRGAQTDLLMAQRTKTLEESLNASVQRLLMFSQIDQTKIGTAKMQFELARDMEFKQYQATALELENLKKGSELETMSLNRLLSLDANERAELKNVSDIKEATQRILSMKEGVLKSKAERRKIAQDMRMTEVQIHKLGYDIQKLNQDIRSGAYDLEFKEYEAQLQREGIMPGTPAWYRATQIFIERVLRGGSGGTKGSPLGIKSK